MFTLNQDLWAESYLYSQHVSGAAAASLPGLQRGPNQRLFTAGIGHYNDAFVMRPIADPEANAQLGGTSM